MNTNSTIIQTCSLSDFSDVRRIINQSEGLDKHTSYTYWLALHEWPDLFLVARRDDQIVGFVFGLRSHENKDRIFLWQIGVLASHRRLGIAKQLAIQFCKRGAMAGGKEIWLTISDKLMASKTLFQNVATELGTQLIERGTTGDMCGHIELETIQTISLSHSRLF